MARNPDYEPLYNAYQDFAQLCLVEDRSLLWPDRALWTPANVSVLRHALIDAPEMGSESFEAKLIIQMSGLSSDVWGLLADAYYLYCLVPETKNIKAETKYAGIVSLAQKGNLPIPDEHDMVWKALAPGFCHPGMRYMQKYRQFWLIFVFAEQVKQAPDRQTLLKDRHALQNALDASLEKILIPANRGTDMRHALLYLAFPDYYERIVSTGNKKSIVASFKDRLPGAVPTDVDDAIYQIYQVLEKDETLPKPLDFYHPQIKPLWKNIIPTLPVVQQVKETVPVFTTSGPALDMLSLFKFTKNVIIYGPPGTGKTFIANQVAKELVKKQLEAPVPETIRLQNAAEANTFYDLLALGMYRSGKEKHYNVKEIQELPLVQARFTIRPVKNPKENIWAYLQSHTALESKTVNVGNKAEPYLFDKDGDSRWYLTAAGQNYVIQNLGEALALLKQPAKEASKAEDFITRVAFHQSYAYEDFVEGFRPVGANEIEVVPGKFREVCAQAAGNPEANYVLIIDEINRGNISKIFGELITLLEDDKRDGQPASFPVELAYSHVKFIVPGNLYIIGTMNTADRSIALLDVALRRRFSFYELLPDPELLQGQLIESEDGDQVDLGKMLRGLNERICKELGADYQIGHSYLMKVNSLAGLEFAWNNQILPLLREYFYSQPERLQDILEPYLKGLENSTDLHREGSDLVIALNELAK
jgi:MoxR-like ATPase